MSEEDKRRRQLSCCECEALDEDSLVGARGRNMRATASPASFLQCPRVRHLLVGSRYGSDRRQNAQELFPSEVALTYVESSWIAAVQSASAAAQSRNLSATMARFASARCDGCAATLEEYAWRASAHLPACRRQHEMCSASGGASAWGESL